MRLNFLRLRHTIFGSPSLFCKCIFRQSLNREQIETGIYFWRFYTLVCFVFDRTVENNLLIFLLSDKLF